MQQDKLKNIKEEISRQADREISIIKDSAEAEINKLKEELKNRQEKFSAEKDIEFRREGELKKREIITEKKLHLKKEILNKKRELIESIYDAVIEELKKLKKDDYRNFMEKLFKEVIVTENEKIIPAATEKIFDKHFIDRINKKFNWKLKLGGETAQIKDGFLLKERDYEIVVDWDSIKDFIRQKEEERIVRELFKAK